MPRKTFRRAVGAEPVEITLEGAVRIRTFPCRTSMSAGVLLKFTEAFTDSELDEVKEATNGVALTEAEQKKATSQGAAVVPLLKDFFSAAIQKESVAAFWDMVYDTEEEIDLPMLMEITEWLTETYSGERPTTENSPSTSGETSTGGGSQDGQPAGVIATPTYSRPEPTSSST